MLNLNIFSIACQLFSKNILLMLSLPMILSGKFKLDTNDPVRGVKPDIMIQTEELNKIFMIQSGDLSQILMIQSRDLRKIFMIKSGELSHIHMIHSRS